MAKHRIAILSDTHGLLRHEAIEVLSGCEVILHGGDINSSEIVKKMQDIAPFYVVRGNNDKEWAEDMPISLQFDLFGFSFYMCHKKKDIELDSAEACDFVIFGHSHKYEVLEQGKCTYINPGSCGPRRFLQPITMAVLSLDDEVHDFTIEKIDMSPVLSSTGDSVQISEKDLDKIVATIIKEMDAGKGLSDIAKKNRVDIELVDSICRMYSTHPGVSIGGIIDKLELRKIYRK